MKKTFRGIELLRAISIIAVVIYHINANFLPGGFLAVTLFFVLSGYLAMTSMKASYERDGRFSFKSFLVRRLKKLYPSLFIMIALTLIFMVLFNKETLVSSHKDAVAGLTFTSNWWYIIRKVGYFDSYATSPFKHLWYLGVLFQAYLILGLVFKFTHKGKKIVRDRKIFLITSSLIVLVSLLLHIILFDVENVSRTYYGTDTRIFEFFLGAIFGYLFSLYDLRKLGAKRGWLIKASAYGSLIIFILASNYISELSYWIYPFGLLLTCILGLVMIFSWSQMRIPMGLSWLLLIGKLSYELYLWHFPVVVLSESSREITGPNFLYTLLRVIVFTALSILTQYLVGRLTGKGRLIPYIKSLFIDKKAKNKRLKYPRVVAATAFSILFVMGIFGLAMPYTSTAFANNNKVDLESSIVVGQEKPTESETNKGKTNKATSKDGEKEAKNPPSSKPATNTKPETENPNPSEKGKNTKDGENQGDGDKDKDSPTTTKDKYHRHKYDRIVVIGDSLSVNVGPAVKKVFDNTIVDGKVSRQLYKSGPIARKYASYDSDTTAVIFMLGTNGRFRESHVDEIVKPFKKSDIYFINVKMPDIWEKEVNDTLKSYTDKHPNIYLIDWYNKVKDHPEYLAKDKTHLMRIGVDAMLDLIFAALDSNSK